MKNKSLIIKNTSIQTLFYVLKQILIILHPFIPFVTEEIYQKLNLKKSIMLETYPKINFNYNIDYLNLIIEIISKIREIRKKYKIKIQYNIKIWFDYNYYNNFTLNEISIINKFILKIVNSKIVGVIGQKDEKQEYLIIPLLNNIIEISFNKIFDKIIKQQEIIIKLNNLKKELERSKNILNNKNFLLKANPEKIKIEKEKYIKYLEQYKKIENNNFKN